MKTRCFHDGVMFTRMMQEKSRNNDRQIVKLHQEAQTYLTLFLAFLTNHIHRASQNYVLGNIVK
jgi:hypothetical protein